MSSKILTMPVKCAVKMIEKLWSRLKSDDRDIRVQHAILFWNKDVLFSWD